MKVSVAMTTYNGELYLIEQLDSLREQEMKIDQLVICDDGSKDDTVKIVNEYISKYNLEDSWQIIQNEKNLGYADNFHKAASLCNGDYIFFADQDDIWKADKIKNMVSIMESNHDIKLLYSDYEPYYCTDDAPVLTKDVVDKMTGDKSVVKQDLNTWSIYIRSEGCTMCFRKTFWDRIQKYWFSGWAHDEFVWKLALCEDGLYTYHESTMKRRLHSNNVSKRKMRDLGKRIDYSKKLKESHIKMLEYANDLKLSQDVNKLIQKNIECIDLRIQMMENKKLLNLFPLIFKYARYYYSKKSIPTEFYMALKG